MGFEDKTERKVGCWMCTDNDGIPWGSESCEPGGWHETLLESRDDRKTFIRCDYCCQEIEELSEVYVHWGDKRSPDQSRIRFTCGGSCVHLFSLYDSRRHMRLGDGPCENVAYDGVVYFILDPNGDAIKIGWTRSAVKKRLAQLRTGNSRRLLILGTIPGSQAIEAKIHDHFQQHRTNGEWFRYKAVMDDVMQIIRKGWPIHYDEGELPYSERVRPPSCRNEAT